MARRKNDLRVSFFSFQDIITSVTGIIILITLILAVELTHRKMERPKPSPESYQKDATLREVRRLEEELARREQNLPIALQELTELAQTSAAELAKKQEALQRSIELLQQQLPGLKSALATAKKDDAQVRAEMPQKVEADQAETAALQQEIDAIKKKLSDLRERKTLIYNKPAGSTKAVWMVDLKQGRIEITLLGRKDTVVLATVSELLAWTGRPEVRGSQLFILVRPSASLDVSTIADALRDRNIQVGWDLIGEDQVVTQPSNPEEETS